MPSPTTHNPAQAGSNGGGDTKPGSADEKLLKQIRTRWDYMVQGWKAIGDAGDLDMAALGPNGPWDPKERAARKKAKRPCIHLDQLNQYPNTLTNQFRLNPIGVKVEPKGYGATSKTATLRGDRIRGIEYESDAMTVYETALRCAAERGYGVITLETEDIAWDSIDQRIKMVRHADPNCVVYDPDCREADSSDMADGFTVWSMPMTEFKQQFGEKATVTDFNINHQLVAPSWVNVDRQTVMVAKYSYYENVKRRIYWVERGNGQPAQKIFKDQLGPGWTVKDGFLEHEGGAGLRILQTKDAIQKKIKRCITNGIEILERTDWPGSRIPIFPLLGKEKYIRKNGVTERILESQIRMAIDGQRGFDSAKTNQVETANMVPKAIYLGYQGQFNTSTDWPNINKIATATAEVVAMPDGVGGVLPLPQRTDFNPQIEPMEVMSESYRRAIQSAIGSHGFTVNDDTNIKTTSGIKALKSQSDVGNYHFEANAKVTIRAVLREVNYLLDKIEDTDREVGTVDLQGKHNVVRINAVHNDPKSGQPVEHRYSPRDPKTGEPMTDAWHEVVVFTGPTEDTQLDNASDFVDGLVKDERFGPRVVDLAIKWRGKDLGTYAEQMAERVTLPEFQNPDGQPDIPPQVKQQMGKIQQQNKELVGVVQDLLKREEAKTADLESKEKIAAVEAEVKKFGIEAGVLIARIGAAAKGVIIHEELTSAENLHLSEQIAGEQIADLAHRQTMTEQQAGADQTAQQSAQDHSQALEASAQGHDQNLEAGAQGHDQTMEQQDAASQDALASQTQAEAAAPAPPEA